MASKRRKETMVCHREGCNEPPAWRVRFYYNENSEAERRFGTRDRLECEVHGQESKEINPFLGGAYGWSRL